MKISKNLDYNPKNILVDTKNDKIKNDIKTKATQEETGKNFSIKTVLDSLFHDLITNQKSKDTILQILKDKNIFQNIKSTVLELKSILNDLKNSKLPLKSIATLDDLLLDIDKIDAKSLQKQIKNSGIFLESRIAKADNPKNIILQDIKANLLMTKKELSESSEAVAKDVYNRVDKVLTSINYYQLISLSMGSNMLYLPLLWEGLDEGQVSIKKLKQKRYFCEINLKLKDFGKIDLLIMLFDDTHINISIFVQNDHFLKSIRENLQILRQSISSLGLVSKNIYLYDSLKDDVRRKETMDYVQNQQIGNGISLHV